MAGAAGAAISWLGFGTLTFPLYMLHITPNRPMISVEGTELCGKIGTSISLAQNNYLIYLMNNAPYANCTFAKRSF
jgi:hypothetical protein